MSQIDDPVLNRKLQNNHRTQQNTTIQITTQLNKTKHTAITTKRNKT